MRRSSFPMAVTVATLIFLYLPIIMLVANSFNASPYGGPWKGWTLVWYQKLWQNRPIWHALQKSLLIGVGASGVATALGTLSALAIHRFKTKLQDRHLSIIYAPLLLPDILIGISLLTFFIAIGGRLGLTSVFIAHTTFCISYVAIIVLARLQQFDYSTVEAAQDLGAGWWTVLLKVVMPQLRPGIIAGALLAFTMSIDDFVITYFVAGPGATTLPVYIYGMIKHGPTPMINALSTLILVLTLSILYLSQRLSRETSE